MKSKVKKSKESKCKVLGENFAKDAAHWNKTHFGNVFKRKKNIMTRLNEIQQLISIRPLSFLLNLERELQGELEMVLK